ncbi:A nuclease family of the HNH/ENDO VII superfamily with conserved AHH [Actinopolymorpha cephalotaxi]|uniref:A nuclease family of the HNH/ENDO VII superfamily with conserved AHH n=1 Tax=Actinopolymorpha cephalotaxi TaxID=504797 RepID=A0A1I2LDZ5_9ACTN|nr:AHH domain-containing protein [Actinopolymorpha cephalotaxi]NYH85015.1 hypothetical protein [Actinopolymorpha cephalotaxi]SFF75697.1 A nuclease family of the HNH/ENDO VII superfamily with conserved AHH [Actinopolymorpha cephalotaxi]
MATVPKAALVAAAKRARITRAAADLLRLAAKPSSKNLGHNLEVAGRHGLKVNGKLVEDAAHLVPKGATRPFAKLSQGILKKFNIHLDEPVNGSWLPHGRDPVKYPNPLGKSPHQATHRDAYYEALYKLLKPCKTADEAADVLDYVRAQLDKGIWP